ncbi:site-specific integrase [Spirillospora sp. NPDC048819]|uniref:site-specific integrase n=1 Tax=Spirillospora sp. NPDC048819 TaxID=3155268 RepID=UPI0033DA00EA
MIWIRHCGRCGCGPRPPRTGWNGWCRTRRRPGCCCRGIWLIGRQSAGARGPLFLSESRRNHAQPLSLWTWSKVVRKVALDAGVPQFSTHTTRHLCLTDLARMGWELHAIATFAGHRSTESTLAYIHLSGRDLADKLATGMEHIHAWRVRMLTASSTIAAETAR